MVDGQWPRRERSLLAIEVHFPVCVFVYGSTAMARRAIYPGTFDPLTNGHLDIIARASYLFDEVIVALLINAGKNPMFTVPERVEILNEVLPLRFSNVSVETFEGLLVD